MVQFDSGNIAGKVYFVLAMVAIAIVYFGVPVTCINHYSYCDPMMALHDNPLALIVALILTGVVVEILVLGIRGRREKEQDEEGTKWAYHPPPERKPETGVGSEAWEANRAREIRELREEKVFGSAAPP